MKTSPTAYKILLALLHGLIYAKRGLAAGLFFFWRGIIRLNDAYKRTIGFRVFKVLFYIKRKINRGQFFHPYSFVDMFGERRVLQIGLVVILFLIALPQTRVYTKESNQIPGRNTLLYKLVGPGDQDFDLTEEIFIEINSPLFQTSERWREGAVVARPSYPVVPTGPYYEEIAGTIYGGQAVTKPILIPGAKITPQSPSGDSGKRAAIVYYEVKSGDVIGNIARSFGISIETILWANNLSIRSYIRPGDQLKILPFNGVTHKVARGETIFKIARVYGAIAEEIITFNKLVSGADISIGQELIIPNGKKVTSGVSTLVQRAGQTIKSTVFNKVVAPYPSIIAPAGSNYLWPTTASIITQYFGWRHTGVDIAGKLGIPNYAAKAGQIIKSQCGWNGGYGCYIIIDHGNGVQTLYAHNSRLLVSVGEYVNQGQAIALLGSTGRSTGPHVHFEIRVNGKRANPLQYIRR